MNKGSGVCSQEISHIDLIWLFSSLGSGVEDREVQGSVCLSFVRRIDKEIWSLNCTFQPSHGNGEWRGSRAFSTEHVPIFKYWYKSREFIYKHHMCACVHMHTHAYTYTYLCVMFINSMSHISPLIDSIDDCFIHLLAGPFKWKYVPRFLCCYKFCAVGKWRRALAIHPWRNALLRRGVLYREQLTALHFSGYISLYSCITTNDKWVMFDSWLRCLTATVLARGPRQALDFCSKWVKHIRYYEATEASRMSAEMSYQGMLLGTQLAKQMSF